MFSRLNFKVILFGLKTAIRDQLLCQTATDISINEVIRSDLQVYRWCSIYLVTVNINADCRGTMSYPEKQVNITKDEWVAKLEENSYTQRISMNNLIMNYLVTGKFFFSLVFT